MAPRKDFNEKAKKYLYSISVKPERARKSDYTAPAQSMADKIRDLATEEGYEEAIKINIADKSLARLGIFFLNAPEKFAAKVKKLDGVTAVEKPSPRKKKTSSRKRKP